MAHITGTSHFRTHEDAAFYYAAYQGIELEHVSFDVPEHEGQYGGAKRGWSWPDVMRFMRPIIGRKISEGEIHVGPPSILSGQRLVIIPGEGRYGIIQEVG